LGLASGAAQVAIPYPSLKVPQGILGRVGKILLGRVGGIP